MILKILLRVAGYHLVQAEWRKLGGEHLQATVEGLAWRGIVVAAGALYAQHPAFKDGVDQIVAALGG